MSETLNRKIWLSKFLGLVDSDASAMMYRRTLGISLPALQQHIKNIGAYRAELAILNSAPVPVQKTSITMKPRGTSETKERNS
jgi:transposase-like protein